MASSKAPIFGIEDGAFSCPKVVGVANTGRNTFDMG